MRSWLVLVVLTALVPGVCAASSARAPSARAQREFDLGTRLGRQGRLAPAIRHLQRAVRLRPAFAPAHFNLGVLYQATGKEAAAQREFRKTLRYDPRAANAELNLGILLAKRGSPEAARHCRKAERLQPGLTSPSCPR